MYYSTIPLVAERAHNRRWDASKLRELRKRLDSGTCTVEEIDGVATDFLDGEIVDLASDWLGNTVSVPLSLTCDYELILAPIFRFDRLSKSCLRNALLAPALPCSNVLHLISPWLVSTKTGLGLLKRLSNALRHRKKSRSSLPT